MSEKYKMRDKDKAYFVTLTVVDWQFAFHHANDKTIIVESLIYCQQHKGLEIYAWCLMSNHLHMIVRAVGEQTLSEILRDFKKFTSKAMVKMIMEDPGNKEFRMVAKFRDKAKNLKRIKNYKFWLDGNHPIMIFSNKIFHQKLNYIHNNPVKAKMVANPED
jgi:REP element-mobilizing transposase RayT